MGNCEYKFFCGLQVQQVPKSASQSSLTTSLEEEQKEDEEEEEEEDGELGTDNFNTQIHMLCVHRFHI